MLGEYAKASINGALLVMLAWFGILFLIPNEYMYFFVGISSIIVVVLAWGYNLYMVYESTKLKRWPIAIIFAILCLVNGIVVGNILGHLINAANQP